MPIIRPPFDDRPPFRTPGIGPLTQQLDAALLKVEDAKLTAAALHALAIQGEINSCHYTPEETVSFIQSQLSYLIERLGR